MKARISSLTEQGYCYASEEIENGEEAVRICTLILRDNQNVHSVRVDYEVEGYPTLVKMERKKKAIRG